jgi:hypothetical protein
LGVLDLGADALTDILLQTRNRGLCAGAEARHLEDRARQRERSSGTRRSREEATAREHGSQWGENIRIDRPRC